MFNNNHTPIYIKCNRFILVQTNTYPHYPAALDSKLLPEGVN